MNRDQLFKRTAAVLKPAVAREEVWTFIGVGSGGARVAEEAARFGVGAIILVDRPGETLEEHNIIRHVLGYRDLGRQKIHALRDHLLNINPECHVETISVDVVLDRQRISEIINRSTQVHLCTDNERSKHVVNEATVKAGVTMIFAGVFDGGCGGEIGRVVRQGACYACIATYLNRSARFEEQEIPETFDYTNPNGPEKSTSALNLDIAQIALIQARLGLLTMLARQDEAADLQSNYVLFGNRPVEGLFPRMLFSEFWEIPRDVGCLVCGNTDISDADANAAAELILARADCQTNRGA